MNCESKMLKTLFAELEARDIGYCVLRNADEILTGICNDVDVAVDWEKIDMFKDILHTKLPEIGWQVFVMKENDQGELLSIHLATQTGKVVLMHLDAFQSFNWKGIPLVSNQIMLADRIRYQNIWICSKGVEVTLKLFSKYLHSGEVREKYRSALQNDVLGFREEILTVTLGFLPFDTAKEVLELVEARRWNELHNIIDRVRAAICRKYFDGSVIQRVAYTTKRSLYLGKKFFAKNGPVVAFEGCDGSGKSTIINLLPEKLGRVYNKEAMVYYHWRPNVILRKEDKISDGKKMEACIPHDKKPYNKLISLAKFIAFNLDYTAGYLLGVKKNVGQGKLVVFDRYYYDYFVDRYRYRLNISDTVLKNFLWIIPKPDLTIVLVGVPETIYERKKEIPLEEVKHQISRLKEYSPLFHNAKLISVDGTPSQIADAVCREIVDIMIYKYRNKNSN